MSTAYVLVTGPSAGRIDASGYDGLGVYEIKNSRIELDDYDAAAQLVDRYSHVSWLADDPGPPTDDSDDNDSGTETDSEVTESTTDDSGDGDDNDGDETDAAEMTAEADAGDGGDATADDAAAGDDAVDLEECSYRELQELAQDYDIQANQSADVLIDAISAARDD